MLMKCPANFTSNFLFFFLRRTPGTAGLKDSQTRSYEIAYKTALSVRNKTGERKGSVARSGDLPFTVLWFCRVKEARNKFPDSIARCASFSLRRCSSWRHRSLSPFYLMFSGIPFSFRLNLSYFLFVCVRLLQLRRVIIKTPALPIEKTPVERARARSSFAAVRFAVTERHSKHSNPFKKFTLDLSSGVV